MYNINENRQTGGNMKRGSDPENEDKGLVWFNTRVPRP